MYKSLKKALQSWNDETNERQKLQHVYVALVIVLVVVAGLVGLVNYQLSQNILMLVFAAAVLFVTNTIVWALLQSLVLLPLDKKSTAAPSRSRQSRSTRR